MEDLLKGSGVEELYRGGLSKGVAFVRKAMVETKKKNRGYRPPARYGYDFDVAKELDKPSEHIQTNIGEVPKADVVKYQYDRNRKKSAEEKRREEVHKFEYWGLTRDDFDEIDGQLIERKHGLIWGPIFFKPAGREEGVWGLRCCRYDKKGKKIPSNKKYEFLYVKEDDPKNPDDIEAIFPQSGRRWDKDAEKGDYWVDTIDLVKADPPAEITNTNDEGDEVMLKQYFAKGRTEQRFAFGMKLKRRRRPFFWFNSFYNQTKKKTEYEEVPPNAETITYKDIPTIISANRVMRKIIDGAMNSRYYGSEMLSQQQDRWDKHLSGLQQRVRLTGTRDHIGDGPYNNYRDIGVEPRNEKQEAYIKKLQQKIREIDEKIENTPRDKRITKKVRGQQGIIRTVEGRRKIESLRDTRDRYNSLLMTALQPKYTKKEIDYASKTLKSTNGGPITYKGNTYTQTGVQSSKATDGNNRWGQARAEYALERIEDRQEELSDRVYTLNYVITLNETLIRKLVKNPLNLPINEVIGIPDDDDRNSDPLDYDREDEKKFMKKAKERAKKQRAGTNLEGLDEDENNPPDDE